MKKVVIMGLCLGYMVGIHSFDLDTIAQFSGMRQQQIKNDLRYGVAKRTEAGDYKVVNICSMGTKQCEIGKVKRDGVEVSPIVYLRLQNEEFYVPQPTIINSGETKTVYFKGDQVNIIAYYGDLPIKFTAPVRPGILVYPDDFKMAK